jgi:hypothetical protein
MINTDWTRVVLGFFSLASLTGCGVEPGHGNRCDVSTVAALESLAAEGDLTCDLEIAGTSFTNLDALEGLRSVASPLVIVNNESLSNIDALRPVIAPSFQLNGNPVLPALSFDMAGEVADFALQDNGALRTVSAANITRAENFALNECPIAAVDTPSLIEVGTLSMNKTALESMPFPSLTRVSSLVIVDNAELDAATIDAFLAQLDAPPVTVQRCGNQGDVPCPAAAQ